MDSKKIIVKNKRNIIIIVILLVMLILGLLLILSFPVSNTDKISDKGNNENVSKVKSEKVDIININSKTRPLAISINNTPIAIQVQQGLNNAYLIYEIPTEGYTSRLLALFKDVDNTKVGTIRSARHNFIDFALESDAIFVSFGWSHYAKDDLNSGSIDFIQGLEGIDEGNMFRENPENLAYEHTVNAYTDSIYDYALNIKNYSKESSDTILLNYCDSDVDLSNTDGAVVANKVTVNYGDITTEFIYDSTEKMYKRVVNGTETKDYLTKESFTTKNIIIEKVSYNMCDDNHYWCLNTIGSGNGYYITNGYAVPIEWNKESRISKTKYTYLDGEEISVSDGRTYIEVQILERDTSIE